MEENGTVLFKYICIHDHTHTFWVLHPVSPKLSILDIYDFMIEPEKCGQSCLDGKKCEPSDNLCDTTPITENKYPKEICLSNDDPECSGTCARRM